MKKSIRKQFPVLQRKQNQKSLVFLDGPAGTQVPTSVIQSISNYYKNSNANKGGAFLTSRETNVMMQAARETVATFFGAEGAHTISFGQNMTTLNYALARAIGRYSEEGDEILITALDHEVNRDPWLALREYGLVIREVKIKKDGTLNYKDFQSKINEKTRLVAMGWASNITGAINDVALVRQWTHEVGAWLMVDAVHFAPHFLMDVRALGCDFLICSAYKFYGPHVGLLYSKPGLLDRLPTDTLRTAPQQAPYKIESGTQNHAAIAGVKASIDFLATMGTGKTLRARLQNAMQKIRKHEHRLAKKLHNGLSKINGIEIIGPSFRTKMRAPTISFFHQKKSASQICEELAQENIFAWSGHFYAIRSMEVLGLLEKGGVTRMGISIYISEKDIDRTLKVLQNKSL